MDEFYQGEMGPLALLEYLDGLPSHSRMAAAIAQDDEMAELLLEHAETAPDVGPSLTEMTPEAVRLDQVMDRLGELIGAVIFAAGQKAPKIRPVRRPTTALQRVRERVAEAKYDALVDHVAERRRVLAERRANTKSEGG